MLRTPRVLPEGSVLCWSITEDERLKALKEQKQFYLHYPPYLCFRRVNVIDHLTIEGYLGRWDEYSSEATFHSQITTIHSYFTEYAARKPVYFTFDGISLHKVTELMQEKSNVRFILRKVEVTPPFKKNQAFMIMPFHNTKLDKIFFDTIKPFLKEKLGIEIYRSDSFRDNDVVSETIYNLIEDSEFIIAETSVENKNAFYELGYAAKCGKEIITIQNKTIEQRLFFDRAHIRSILYSEEEINAFKFDLEETIKSIRGRS